MTGSIRMTDWSTVFVDDDGHPIQITHMDVRLSSDARVAVGDYTKRFGLQDKPLDIVLSDIFNLGLKEAKAVTSLDRYLDEQDEQHMDKVKA